MASPREMILSVPEWAAEYAADPKAYVSVEDRMWLAVELSRRNVETGTGGPFGAAVFERDSGRLVAVGTNLVVSSGNSILHAEVVALMLAQRAVGSYSLRTAGDYDLFASCDPCAMCLGATLWSGITRLVTGASRDDATRAGFDEGPVFDESYDYLRERGIDVVRGVLREDAATVLDEYAASGAPIYNP